MCISSVCVHIWYVCVYMCVSVVCLCICLYVYVCMHLHVSVSVVCVYGVCTHKMHTNASLPMKRSEDNLS